MIKKIENKCLIVKINLDGGCLTRLYDKKKNKEVVYDGKGQWPFSDHVLFPVIGNNKTYSIDGKDCSLPKNHGFAWYSKFKIVNESKSSLTIKLTSKDIEKNNYPFSFELEIENKLEENKFICVSKITPIDPLPLVYQYGLHPAFNANFASANLEIEKGTTLFVLEKGIIQKEIEWPFSYNWKVSREEITKKDTLVLSNSNGKITFNNGYGSRITLISSCPYFALWTPEQENKDDFLCVESWYGLSPYVNMPMELKERKDVQIINKEITYIDTLLVE